MKLFCAQCRAFMSLAAAYIIDPNVRTAAGLASTFHPWCYAFATAQITAAEWDLEAAAGQEFLNHRRRSPTFAALNALAGRGPASEPQGRIVVNHRLAADARVGRAVDIVSDYAIYPD